MLGGQQPEYMEIKIAGMIHEHVTAWTNETKAPHKEMFYKLDQNKLAIVRESYFL